MRRRGEWDEINPYAYSSAADYARLSGYDRSTIYDWIRQGKISVRNKTYKSKKKNRNCKWKISHYEMMRPKIKENPKWKTTWKPYEVKILKDNMNLDIDTLSRMIGRTKNAVKIKKCRLKRIER